MTYDPPLSQVKNPKTRGMGAHRNPLKPEFSHFSIIWTLAFMGFALDALALDCQIAPPARPPCGIHINGFNKGENPCQSHALQKLLQVQK